MSNTELNKQQKVIAIKAIKEYRQKLELKIMQNENFCQSHGVEPKPNPVWNEELAECFKMEKKLKRS